MTKALCALALVKVGSDAANPAEWRATQALVDALDLGSFLSFAMRLRMKFFDISRTPDSRQLDHLTVSCIAADTQPANMVTSLGMTDILEEIQSDSCPFIFVYNIRMADNGINVFWVLDKADRHPIAIFGHSGDNPFHIRTAIGIQILDPQYAYPDKVAEIAKAIRGITQQSESAVKKLNQNRKRKR